VVVSQQLQFAMSLSRVIDGLELTKAVAGTVPIAGDSLAAAVEIALTLCKMAQVRT
jgi:hypothetical protein